MRTTPLLLLLVATAAAATTFTAWDGHALRDPQVLLEEAQTLADSDPPLMGLALRKIDRALSLEPSASLRADLIRERAELRGRSRTYELALSDWLLLLKDAPGDEEILNKLASLAINMRDSDRAIEIFELLLKDAPNNSWVRAKLGVQETLRADGEVQTTYDRLFELLPTTVIDEAWPLILQIAHLPISDPVREGIIARLDKYLAPRSHDAMAIVRGALPQLAEAFAIPRETYVQSIELGINEFNSYGLIEQFKASGRVRDTADFGMAAAGFSVAFKNPDAMQLVALALEELGKPLSAAVVVELAMKDAAKWHDDYLPAWCDILYRAEKWPQLKSVSARLANHRGATDESRSTRALGALYLGLASFHLDGFSDARNRLNVFFSASIPEPFPNANAIALVAIADSYKALGEGGEEKKALERCMDLAPDYSAAVYQRSAEMIINYKDSGLLEANYLAHAIRLDSRLAADLLPKFEAAGKRGVLSSRINLDGLIRDLSLEGWWYPETEQSAYILWELAARYTNSGQSMGALLTLRKLRRTFPGFAPAYDKESELLLADSRHAERLDCLLERMTWSGPEPGLLLDMKDAMAHLEGAELDSTQLLEWMLLDPTFTGSLEIARGFQSEGKSAQAYTALMGTTRTLYTDSDRLLFGEVLSDLGQYEGVLDATAQVGAGSPSIGNSSLIRARAALFLGRPAVLKECLDTIDELDPELDEALARDVLSLMISGGLNESALQLATHLATSTTTVSGRNLSLAAVASAIMGEREVALEWIELAHAFVDDFSPTLGLLLLHLQGDELEAIPPLARELRDAAPDWSRPTHLALLAALEGRLGEARALTLKGLEAEPHQTTWHLLGAALNALGATPIEDVLGAGLGKDAKAPLQTIRELPASAGRELIAMLLAMDAPEWSAWADARLGKPVYRTLLGPYGFELTVRSAMSRGELELAKTLANQAIRRWPLFAPFWDQLEELALAEYGLKSAPEVAAVRRRRRLGGVPPHNGVPPTEVELLLDSATETAGRGDAAEALKIARSAQVAEPLSLDARLAVARLARDVEPLAAINGYVGYLAANELQPHFESERATEELISFLRLRGTAQPSANEYEARRNLLELLISSSPEDPLPVIELSRLDTLGAGILKLGADAQLIGVGIALDRMAKFQYVNRQRVFNDLRPGSAESWFEFLVTYDPEAAFAFANLQLQLAPRRLKSWALQAQGLEAVGRIDEAMVAWKRIVRMTADPEVALQTARLLGEVGGAHSEVAALLQIAERSPNRELFARRLEFYRARSLVTLAPDQVSQGVALLEKLAADKDKSTNDVSSEEINYTLGLSLLRRAQKGDGPRARKLFLALAEVETDPLRVQLLRSLGGLGFGLDREVAARQKSGQP